VAQSTLSPELGFAAFRVSWRLVGAATARQSDFRRGGCSDMAVGGGCGGALQLRERRGWLLWWPARREGADAAWLQVCANRGLSARWCRCVNVKVVTRRCCDVAREVEDGEAVDVRCRLVMRRGGFEAGAAMAAA